MTTNRQTLINKLVETALRLIDHDTDNSDRHQRIADHLTQHGRRKFGPRFGDDLHKPQTPGACPDEDDFDEIT